MPASSAVRGGRRGRLQGHHAGDHLVAVAQREQVELDGNGPAVLVDDERRPVPQIAALLQRLGDRRVFRGVRGLRGETHDAGEGLGNQLRGFPTGQVHYGGVDPGNVLRLGQHKDQVADAIDDELPVAKLMFHRLNRPAAFQVLGFERLVRARQFGRAFLDLALELFIGLLERGGGSPAGADVVAHQPSRKNQQQEIQAHARQHRPAGRLGLQIRGLVPVLQESFRFPVQLLNGPSDVPEGPSAGVRLEHLADAFRPGVLAGFDRGLGQFHALGEERFELFDHLVLGGFRAGQGVGGFEVFERFGIGFPASRLVARVPRQQVSAQGGVPLVERGENGVRFRDHRVGMIDPVTAGHGAPDIAHRDRGDHHQDA